MLVGQHSAPCIKGRSAGRPGSLSVRIQSDYQIPRRLFKKLAGIPEGRFTVQFLGIGNTDYVLGIFPGPTERVSVDLKSKAVVFLRLLKSKDVPCYLFFLLDFMSPLSILSHLLQDRTCVIGQQHAEISIAFEVIKKMKTKYV